MSELARRPSFIGEIRDISSLRSNYDLFISGLGYESRAKALALAYRGNAARRVAVGFQDRHGLSYDENVDHFQRRKFHITEVSDAEFRQTIVDEIEAVSSSVAHGSPIRFCVDISSQSRFRLANLVEVFATFQDDHEFEVDFVYALATYAPPSEAASPIASCGPVTSFFAGWPRDPECPVAAILGLGYEAERAIGASEYLEPSIRMTMSPIGVDQRYDGQVKKANKSLLSEVRSEHAFSYRVDRPLECLGIVDGLSYGLLPNNRVILLPFGPKPFALATLITACNYYPQVGVWRISPGTQEEPIQRIESGNFVGLRVSFEGEDPETLS